MPTFSAAYVARLAGTTGFRSDTLEKVLRLGRVLDQIGHHPFLGERLALKGGTALNLFFGAQAPRLSVDLDFNYAGLGGDVLGSEVGGDAKMTHTRSRSRTRGQLRAATESLRVLRRNSSSAQAVEAEGAAGEHLVLGLGGQRPESLAEHLRRAREEAVLVRIVGGPHRRPGSPRTRQPSV